MGIPAWVIYENGRDFGQPYLARLWMGQNPTNSIIRGHSLDDVRRQLPAGLMMMTPHPEDDPAIVETWI